MNEGKFQNNIAELPRLGDTRYENIFKIYNVEDTAKSFYFYNITKRVPLNKNDIDPMYLVAYQIDRDVSWTHLSYALYGSMYLWWLIATLNPQADVFTVKSGTIITIIAPDFLETVLQLIQEQVNR